LDFSAATLKFCFGTRRLRPGLGSGRQLLHSHEPNLLRPNPLFDRLESGIVVSGRWLGASSKPPKDQRQAACAPYLHKKAQEF